MEEILTARQLDDYKRRVFPTLAYDMLQHRDLLKTIVATPQQSQRLRELVIRLEQQCRQREEDGADRLLAVLRRAQNQMLAL